MIHRTRKMTFRLSEKEYEQIKEKIKDTGISQQQFLLKTALGKEIIHIKDFQSLIFQIKKIGININQIAKHSNETGYVNETELSEVKEGVKNIWQLLRQLKTHTQA